MFKNLIENNDLINILELIEEEQQVQNPPEMNERALYNKYVKQRNKLGKRFLSFMDWKKKKEGKKLGFPIRRRTPNKIKTISNPLMNEEIFGSSVENKMKTLAYYSNKQNANNISQEKNKNVPNPNDAQKINQNINDKKMMMKNQQSK